ncbi:T9SS type A sorting domain-containing protein, partial [Flavobacterium sp.]|uniref:Ig-like domain-containing protein n=1 Tax=Flavobacterium sp. TaxID=239 RepID=UPI0025E61F85
ASTTTLSTGNYYVSQTVNSCESARTTVGVTINTTAAPTASSQTFNNSASVANLVAIGTSLQWYSNASTLVPLALTTALVSGTYYVSQTINSCESARTLVSVTVSITPTAPLSNSQNFCNSAVVANLGATGTSLQWYNVATGGTPLSLSTPLTTGNYYVTQTVNSVESPRTSVAVTINTTVVPTAAPQTFCSGATVANLVAAGNALQWYTVTTGETPLSSTTALISGNYYVTQTLNSCESSRILVTVIVNSTVAPTATAQQFCSSATVANLVATGSSLQWFTVSNGGTALAPSTAVLNANYYVSQTVNSCESPRTLVTVTVNLVPAAPSALPQSFCNSGTISNLVATGNALQWYSVATGGGSLSSIASLTTGNYYVSQTMNSCESPRTMFAVTINTTPLPTASSQIFNNAATVANLIASGTSLQWYNVAIGGTALTSATALSSGNYYVSQTINSCESARLSVTVTINVAPTATAQSICLSGTVADLVATGTALKWYNVASGGSVLPLSTALVAGNYYVSQTVNTIESPRTTVAVTLVGVPIAKSIRSSTISGSTTSPICTSTTKILNVRTGYVATSIIWETAVVALNSGTVPASSDYSIISGASGPSYTVTNAVAGKNYFRAKFINGNCNTSGVYSAPFVVYYTVCAANRLFSVYSYPNPYTDNFSLNLTTTSEEKVGVAVYDMTGKLIEERELNSSDISELKIGIGYPSGIYNVVVTQGGEVKTTRVIKR